MAIKIFSRFTLPDGFKLTSEFLASPMSEKAEYIIRQELRPFNNDIIVITQTSLENRPDFKVAVLDAKLEKALSLDNVLSKLRAGEKDSVPQVDGLWFNRAKFPVAVISFSQTAPILTATAGDCLFIGTILKENINEEVIRKILKSNPSSDLPTFRVILSTKFHYEFGTLPGQISQIFKDFGVSCNSSNARDVNSYKSLFGYGETNEFGPINNLVAVF